MIEQAYLDGNTDKITEFKEAGTLQALTAPQVTKIFGKAIEDAAYPNPEYVLFPEMFRLGYEQLGLTENILGPKTHHGSKKESGQFTFHFDGEGEKMLLLDYQPAYIWIPG